MVKQASSSRFMELEGLRGIAALMVVLYHFIALFYPAMRSGDMDRAHTPFEEHVYGTPLTLLFSGGLGVAIFFVLSGFVLSIGFFKTGDQNIVKKLAMGRYLRLMLPALASVLLAWVLIQFGASALTSAAGDIANSKELAGKWNLDPSLVQAMKTGMLDIFVEYKGDSRAINHALWTMNVEFIGSFLVFGFLLFFAQSRYRWAAYAVLTIGTFQTWYLAFVIGVMIADAHSLGRLDRLKRWYVTVPLAAAAVLLGNFPRRNHEETYYGFLSMPFIDISERQFYLIISATLFLLVVLLSRTVAGVLRTPFVTSLGRYTFSLYLTHLLVIYTVSSAVVILFHESIGYNKSVLLAALVSAVAFWLVSYLFERFIDAPSIRLARYVGAVYRGEAALGWSLPKKLVSKSNWLRRRSRAGIPGDGRDAET